MPLLRYGGFLGEMPRIHPRFLPDGGAQIAENLYVRGGALEPMNGNSSLPLSVYPLITGFTTADNVQGLFKLTQGAFLIGFQPLNIAWYSIGSDRFNRIILTTDTGVAPAVTSASLINQEGVNIGPVKIPTPLRFLRIPAPRTSLQIALTGLPDNPADVPETRFYVATYVDEWGAEGPPSPVSSEVEWRPGQIVELSNLPNPPSDAQGLTYNITQLRIYRVNTTSAGLGQYQFVAGLSYGDFLTFSVSALSLESPFGLITTALQHNFQAGDEVIFNGFGPASPAAMSPHFDTGVVRSIPSASSVLIATSQWPSSFSRYDRVFITNLTTGTSAATAYQNTEYHVYPALLSGGELNLSVNNAVRLLQPVFTEYTELLLVQAAIIEEYGSEEGWSYYFGYRYISIRVRMAPGHPFTTSFLDGNSRGLFNTNQAGWGFLNNLELIVESISGDYVTFAATTFSESTFDGLPAIGTELTGITGEVVARPVRNPLATITNVSTTEGIPTTGTMYRCVENITQANPAVVTFRRHGLVDNDLSPTFVLPAGAGMGPLDGNTYTVLRLSADTFSLHTAAPAIPANAVDSTAYPAFVPGFGAYFREGAGGDELQGETFRVVSAPSTTTFRIAQDTSLFTALAGNGGRVAKLTAFSGEYIDEVPSASLAEVLSTTTYDSPPNDLKGIVPHPGGFFLGRLGNTILASEPGAPHAWPFEYRLNAGYEIVSIDIFANMALVSTIGLPYILTGNSPAGLILTELEAQHSNVSRLGTVDFGAYICYPSHEGLLLVLPNSLPINITREIFNKEQWEALDPRSFIGFSWQGNYAACYTAGGIQRTLILDPAAPEQGVRYVDFYARAIYHAIEDNLLYYVDPDDGGIKTFASDNNVTIPYRWRSAPRFTTKPVNMAVAKVFADSYQDLVFRLYGDGIQRGPDIPVGSITPFRLPGGYRAEEWVVEIAGTDRVNEIAIATTMEEMARIA